MIQYLLALSLLLVVSGCKGNAPQKQSSDSQKHQGQEEGRVADILNRFRDARDNTNAAIAAVEEISKYPAVENSEVWMDIATDPHYSDFQRRKALFAFFQRHICTRTPMTLAELIRNPKLKGIMNDSNIYTATAFSYVPIKRALRESVFMLRPDYLKRSHAAVFFSVFREYHGPRNQHPGSIGEVEFIESINDAEKAKNIQILEVAVFVF